MEPRSYHQPPMFDLNNLDDDQEIVMEYDSNGNLTRIRKVRRFEGCGIWVSVISLGILAALGWHFLGA